MDTDLHAALIYFIGSFLEQRSLRTPEGPFVVNLVAVSPDPPPTEQEQSAPQQHPAAESERPPEPSPATIDESAPGLPDAPPLETPPDIAIATPLIEPAYGESAAVDSAVVKTVRRDIAGELSRKLLEEMETLTHLPKEVLSPSDEQEASCVKYADKPLPDSELHVQEDSEQSQAYGDCAFHCKIMFSLRLENIRKVNASIKDGPSLLRALFTASSTAEKTARGSLPSPHP